MQSEHIFAKIKLMRLFFLVMSALFMYDVIAIGNNRKIRKSEYILTGMCYGFEILHVYGPNWTLFIKIKKIQNGA